MIIIIGRIHYAFEFSVKKKWSKFWRESGDISSTSASAKGHVIYRDDLIGMYFSHVLISVTYNHVVRLLWAALEDQTATSLPYIETTIHFLQSTRRLTFGKLT